MKKYFEYFKFNISALKDMPTLNENMLINARDNLVKYIEDPPKPQVLTHDIFFNDLGESNSSTTH
jgi:hypothetical protein